MPLRHSSTTVLCIYSCSSLSIEPPPKEETEDLRETHTIDSTPEDPSSSRKIGGSFFAFLRSSEKLGDPIDLVQRLGDLSSLLRHKGGHIKVLVAFGYEAMVRDDP